MPIGMGLGAAAALGPLLAGGGAAAGGGGLAALLGGGGAALGGLFGGGGGTPGAGGGRGLLPPGLAAGMLATGIGAPIATSFSKDPNVRRVGGALGGLTLAPFLLGVQGPTSSGVISNPIASTSPVGRMGAQMIQGTAGMGLPGIMR